VADILAAQAFDLVPEYLVSDFLFAQPSFLAGIGRAFDIGGVFDDYNVSATPAQADARAIGADWQVVGKDLRDAMAAADAEFGVRQPE
jgi:hypothetical protein